jgi:basic amino acid/polyamine antiporter, APA family
MAEPQSTVTLNEAAQRDEGAVEGSLGLWDAVSLVVGIVVGTAIFRSSTDVFLNTSGPWQALAAWALGGVLSIVGAVCYAELATTYPRSGGDYVYLSRAFGPWAGFLFGWAQLVTVFTSNVGTMAYAFGDYGVELFGLGSSAIVWLAAASIVAMSLVNACGVTIGKWSQNVLTFAKVAGLAAVVIAGVICFVTPQQASRVVPDPGAPIAPTSNSLSFGLAMVFVLYAYGGWNDAAFVAAEVRNRRRNLPLALIGGVAAITGIYLAMNLAYLAALGFDGARRTPTPAAGVLEVAAGPQAARAVSVVVMISALGAINGMILSRSRVFATMGADHRIFSWLAGWDRGHGVPRRAIAAQAAVTLAMVVSVGTERGQRAIDGALRAFGAQAIPWREYYGGFETLMAATAPVFWVFFLATGVAMMVLRWREPQRERPFSVPLYPLPPLVFCATCGFMLYHSVRYARWLTVVGVAPAALGLAIYAVMRLVDRKPETRDPTRG